MKNKDTKGTSIYTGTPKHALDPEIGEEGNFVHTKSQILLEHREGKPNWYLRFCSAVASHLLFWPRPKAFEQQTHQLGLQRMTRSQVNQRQTQYASISAGGAGKWHNSVAPPG